jgi:phage host-nuclease inhibitor protein Gam
MPLPWEKPLAGRPIDMPPERTEASGPPYPEDVPPYPPRQTPPFWDEPSDPHDEREMIPLAEAFPETDSPTYDYYAPGIENEKDVAWYIGIVSSIDDAVQKVRDQAEKMVKRLEARRKKYVHKYEVPVQDWVKAHLDGKNKSIHFLTGTAGFRATPRKIKVRDEGAAVAWCETHLPKAIKVIPATKKVKHEHIEKHNKATGEIPPGCDWVGGDDKFYIK